MSDPGQYFSVEQSVVVRTRNAIEMGLSYATEALQRHDTELGRTMRRHKVWAEQMERDIAEMKATLSALPLPHPG